MQRWPLALARIFVIFGLLDFFIGALAFSGVLRFGS
jgi:hypothetical protein